MPLRRARRRILHTSAWARSALHCAPCHLPSFEPEQCPRRILRPPSGPAHPIHPTASPIAVRQSTPFRGMIPVRQCAKSTCRRTVRRLEFRSSRRVSPWAGLCALQDPAWWRAFQKPEQEGHEGNEGHEERERQRLEHGSHGNARTPRMTATSTAFLVGVAREPLRRDAQGQSIHIGSSCRFRSFRSSRGFRVPALPLAFTDVIRCGSTLDSTGLPDG